MFEPGRRRARGHTKSPGGERRHREKSPFAEEIILPRPRARSPVIILAEISTLTAIIFLLLVLLGNTRNTPALTGIHFLKIDVSNVIPRSYPNAVLVNSIAQTLGLRGFYQVGLWNYCEGYKSQGVTYCASPRTLYSFDPVSILLSQLLDGATIAVPSNITTALAIAKKASHWMFACFFVGMSFLITSFVVGWFGTLTRRNCILASIISGIAVTFTTVGAAVSTVLYCVFRSVFESAPEFNIRASLGGRMYVFVWLAAGFAVVGFAANVASCWGRVRRRW